VTREPRTVDSKRPVRCWLLAMGYWLLACGVAEACPTCSDMLSTDAAAPAGLARGFYWSILLFLSMPFALVGGMSWLIVRHARQSKQPTPR